MINCIFLFKYLFYFCLFNWSILIFIILLFKDSKNISWFKSSIYFSLLNWFLLLFSIVLFRKRKRINPEQTLITKNYFSSKINIYNKPGLYLFITLLNSKNIILPNNFEFEDIFIRVDKQAIFIEKIKFNLEYKKDINIFNIINIERDIKNNIKFHIIQFFPYYFNIIKKDSQKFCLEYKFNQNTYTYIVKNIIIKGLFICKEKND